MSDFVTITVDGKAVRARPGEVLIEAMERAGTYVPRFCYHPRLRSVGMCRMCLVEVVGPRGPALAPACFERVREGMEVRFDSPAVRKAQDGVLEFLLLNHPLDCPVCDKGGECPLQDQTLAYGPGESRFVEEKRHWAKPIQIGPLLDIDRERCIQCDRCTRFATDIAGEPDINFMGRGDHIEVNVVAGRPFAPYFSGNVVQICPVGALLSRPYRFKARPWDLEQVESTCTVCSVGCRVALQASTGRLVRQLGVDSDPVNHSWLCDKGRYGFDATNSERRRDFPLLREGEEMVPVGWAVALRRVAEGLRDALETGGPSSVGVLGGARLANEDAYAWSKLIKGTIGTDNVDCFLGDGLSAELLCSLPKATIDEACSADVVITIAPDLKEEVPILFLRLREAIVTGRTKLVELVTHRGSLSRLATASILYEPGCLEEAVQALLGSEPASGELENARQLLGDLARSGGRLVVVAGRPSLASSAKEVEDAVLGIHSSYPEAKYLFALRRGNWQGALDAGLAPGLLPGRVSLADGREWYREAWGSVPDVFGLDAAGMLASAAERGMKVLILLGSDPLSDFPDFELARRAIEATEMVVSVETVPNRTSAYADVILPAASYGERGGTTTNLEGRISLLGQLVVAPGVAWPDWMVARELAAVMGKDLGFASLADIRAEMAALSDLHAGIAGVELAGDGVILDREPPGDIGPHWIDPIATPGLLSVETQGSPPLAGRAVAPPDGVVERWSKPRSELRPTGTPPRRLGIPEQRRGPRGRARRSSSDKLVLVATRSLYDMGSLVQSCSFLADLPPQLEARVSPVELAKRGIQSGELVALDLGGKRLEVASRADSAVPSGVVVIGFNLDRSDDARFGFSPEVDFIEVELERI
jgi:NADH-quinone oxidoreductase subunit G